MTAPLGGPSSNRDLLGTPTPRPADNSGPQGTTAPGRARRAKEGNTPAGGFNAALDAATMATATADPSAAPKEPMAREKRPAGGAEDATRQRNKGAPTRTAALPVARGTTRLAGESIEARGERPARRASPERAGRDDATTDDSESYREEPTSSARPRRARKATEADTELPPPPFFLSGPAAALVPPFARIDTPASALDSPATTPLSALGPPSPFALSDALRLGGSPVSSMGAHPGFLSPQAAAAEALLGAPMAYEGMAVLPTIGSPLADLVVGAGRANTLDSLAMGGLGLGHAAFDTIDAVFTATPTPDAARQPVTLAEAGDVTPTFVIPAPLGMRADASRPMPGSASEEARAAFLSSLDAILDHDVTSPQDGPVAFATVADTTSNPLENRIPSAFPGLERMASRLEDLEGVLREGQIAMSNDRRLPTSNLPASMARVEGDATRADATSSTAPASFDTHGANSAFQAAPSDDATLASLRAREMAERIFLPRRDLAALQAEAASSRIEARLDRLAFSDEDVLTDASLTRQATGGRGPILPGLEQVLANAGPMAVPSRDVPDDGARREGSRERRGDARDAGLDAPNGDDRKAGQVTTFGIPFEPQTSGGKERTLAGTSESNVRNDGSALSTAALERARDRALDLQARGGGTAKIQIRDALIGNVDLRVAVSGDGKVSVELRADDERVRKDLEKGISELRANLEKGSLSVAELKVGALQSASDASGQTFARDQGSQAGAQQQQQQQQPQQAYGWQDSAGQNGSWRRGEPRDAAGGPGSLDGKKGSAAENSASRLRQSVIHRGENGSLKVLA